MAKDMLEDNLVVQSDVSSVYQPLAIGLLHMQVVT